MALVTDVLCGIVFSTAFTMLNVVLGASSILSKYTLKG